MFTLLLSFEWVNCWADVNWKQKQRKCYSAAKGISVVKAIHHFCKLSLLALSQFSQFLKTSSSSSFLTTVIFKPLSFTFLIPQRKQSRSSRLIAASAAWLGDTQIRLAPLARGEGRGTTQKMLQADAIGEEEIAGPPQVRRLSNSLGELGFATDFLVD